MKRNVKTEQRSSDYERGIRVGFLFGQVSQAIDHLAAAEGYEDSRAHLTDGLLGLLQGAVQAQAGGSLLDGAEPLPQVRHGSARTHGKRPAAQKVHVRPRHNRALKPEGMKPTKRPKRSKQALGVRAYWAGMTVAERRAEWVRRTAKRNQTMAEKGIRYGKKVA